MEKVVLALTAALLGALASPNDFSSKVVGGSDAADGQFPYMVSLRYLGDHLCGGTIMNQRWVLTAAHCLYRVTPEPLTVVTGTNLLNGGGASYQAAEIVNHDDWTPPGIHDDIALVKLSSPIEFNNKVQAIEVDEEVIGGNENAVLSGWGMIYNGSSYSDTLQFINLTTLTLQECLDFEMDVDQSQICTLTRVGEGACRGDSGGPLARNGKQIGIVSYGKPCAVGAPDIFTRTSYYAAWVKSLIGT